MSPPKSREVTGWLMCRPDALDAHDQQRLACLRTQCPHLDHLADHVTSFAKMIIERTGAQELEAWLARVEADDQPELHSFAAGIRRDLDAVTAGLIFTVQLRLHRRQRDPADDQKGSVVLHLRWRS